MIEFRVVVVVTDNYSNKFRSAEKVSMEKVTKRFDSDSSKSNQYKKNAYSLVEQRSGVLAHGNRQDSRAFAPQHVLVPWPQHHYTAINRRFAFSGEKHDRISSSCCGH